ncbi:hypothetical protein MKJ04_16755 [Pontibacter sp. E15-1]|uniref:hypothetical protein n=1 Tax=Pontibacter sp. E15-1 TaxID=2919918 RepID=UPI001F501BF2|nr:hypothetical protein [Pontibacter sp. E15-1]MCJ8166497.1 hypothetical protein [Pontibacter sp. E15-1]
MAIIETMNRLCPLLIVFFFASCGDNSRESEEIYYVVKEGKNYIKSEKYKDNPPPPTDLTYGEYNFIFVGSDKVYLHTVSHRHLCGFGRSESDYIKVPFIELTPEQIKTLRAEDAASFLDSTMRANWQLYQPYWVVTLSSSTDTITNPAFEQISNYLTKDLLIRYNIRKWTKEESYAIRSKMEGRTYTPLESIKALGIDSSVVCKQH